MSYIIVWRQGLKGAHVSLDERDFLETYSSYEKAEEAAKEMENPSDKWYHDYAIYQEVRG